MIHEADTHGDQGQHKVQTEEMPLDEFSTSIGHTSAPNSTELKFRFVSKEVKGYPEIHWPRKIQQVVDNHGYGNYQGLADFRSIYAS